MSNPKLETYFRAENHKVVGNAFAAFAEVLEDGKEELTVDSIIKLVKQLAVKNHEFATRLEQELKDSGVLKNMSTEDVAKGVAIALILAIFMCASMYIWRYLGVI